MDALAGVTLREPGLLWLLLFAPAAAAFLVARERRRLRLAHRFVAVRLRGASNRARRIRPVFLTLGLAGLVAALAGPRAGHRIQSIPELDANRILLIDLSESMAAEDVGISRLGAAKALLRQIIQSYDGRIALLAFEAEAQIVSPLTHDHGAVGDLLDSLSPGELSSPGSDLGAAIHAAVDLAERVSGPADIILVSDGEDQGSSIAEAVRRARANNLKIFTVTIGSGNGSNIPLARGGVLRDDSGTPVVTTADSAAMSRIAAQTGGQTVTNPFQARALARFLDVLPPGSSSGPQAKMVRVPVERYQWPLAFSLVAFMFGSLVNRGAE